jgi:hypothetical protein
LIYILKEKQEAEEGQTKSHADMNPNQMMKNSGVKMPKMPSYSPAAFPGIPSSLKL